MVSRSPGLRGSQFSHRWWGMLGQRPVDLVCSATHVDAGGLPGGWSGEVQRPPDAADAIVVVEKSAHALGRQRSLRCAP
jgi:hypothetical protein